MHHDRLRMEFAGGDRLRAGKMALAFLKACTVSYGIVQHVRSLPARDPNEPLNQAKHYIAFFELGGLVINLGVMAFLLGKAKVQVEPIGAAFAQGLKNIGAWSAFALLSRAN